MRIGIIGAGMIGSTLAQLWVDAGHDVRLASRHPDELKSMVERLGPRASAGTPHDAAMFGDVVMLTVPLTAVPRSRARPCAGARRKNRARHGERVRATGRCGCASSVRAS